MINNNWRELLKDSEEELFPELLFTELSQISHVSLFESLFPKTKGLD